MEKTLKIDLLEVLVKHDVLPKSFVRNEKIIMEYAELREQGLKGKAARTQLADKYFLGLKTIEFILYGRNRKSIEKH